MNTEPITNVLDFISKEFNENHLRLADIIANPEGPSEVGLVYYIPVTNVEYRNRIRKSPKEVQIEIEYEDAKKAVLYLQINGPKIQQKNPSMIAYGLVDTGHAVIGRPLEDGSYEEMYFVNELELDDTAMETTDQEKFDLFIGNLKKFMNRISSSGIDTPIDRIIFARTIFSPAAFEDETVIFYKNGTMNRESRYNNESQHEWFAFDNRPFTTLSINLELSVKSDGCYSLSVFFSDSEGNHIKLFEEDVINGTNNSMLVERDSNEEGDLHIYRITGKTRDIIR